jgi:hypothetical protein
MVPNLDDLVTEDNAPVDSIFTEKQQRLLTEPLYSSWAGPDPERPFLAQADVGWFHTVSQPPLVPNALLSLDAAPAGNLRAKEGRSYFQWLIGKAPEVVIEIVSDRGGEEDIKMRAYARLGVLFYVIFDPDDLLQGGVLRAFVLERARYEPVEPRWLPEVGLGLKLWRGNFEGQTQEWLRWCDREGRVIPTGAERAKEATEKVKRLEARFRELGIEPQI